MAKIDSASREHGPTLATGWAFRGMSYRLTDKQWEVLERAARDHEGRAYAHTRGEARTSRNLFARTNYGDFVERGGYFQINETGRARLKLGRYVMPHGEAP